MTDEMTTAVSIPLETSVADMKSREIAAQILAEDDVDKVKDLTNLFNLHAQKRNVVRVLKLNGLLDTVTDSIVERFEKQPHNFSTDDLLRCMQVAEQAIDRANKNLSLVETTPPIQLQQNNQVNINIGTTLDREGRQRVTDAVRAYLENLSTSDFVDNTKGELVFDDEDDS